MAIKLMQEERKTVTS